MPDSLKMFVEAILVRGDRDHELRTLKQSKADAGEIMKAQYLMEMADKQVLLSEQILKRECGADQ